MKANQLSRRQLLAAIGAALPAARGGRPGYRVQVSTTVEATDARTPEEAREAAAMFLWIRLVDRFIDPKTHRASFPAMRDAFLKDVKSWSKV